MVGAGMDGAEADRAGKVERRGGAEVDVAGWEEHRWVEQGRVDQERVAWGWVEHERIEQGWVKGTGT